MSCGLERSEEREDCTGSVLDSRVVDCKMGRGATGSNIMSMI